MLVALVAAQTTAPLTEAEKRAYVMCVIEHNLSSTSCKNIAKSQAANNNEATACSTLETFKLTLSLFGCTQADYDLLHKILCEKQHVVACP
ncbi:hypothetical protein Bpfe_021722 [Biomphalaria pfeifferi]|uniref:Uncharacterized protein n=1 Tax=Biomphalaria pfeifferi TaxID=112525 RepID=A0AAD8B7G4_BIOPF|nr:hypothetical protein Bpfe_021722 [Biomphalaria pfeifferi]